MLQLCVPTDHTPWFTGYNAPTLKSAIKTLFLHKCYCLLLQWHHKCTLWIHLNHNAVFTRSNFNI